MSSLSSDLKRLRALQRDLLRPQKQGLAPGSTGEKREKLQADLATLVERSRAAELARQAKLPKICIELGRGTRGLIGHTQPRRLAARSVAVRYYS